MKTKIITIICSVFALIVLMTQCKKDEYKNLDCSKISSAYNANIKPIITANCLSSGCHNAGSVNGDFTVYAGLKSKADNGSLNRRVLLEKTMPPAGALSLDDRKKIKCWIDNGSLNN